MQNKQGYLFTLQLRICKQMVKLHVYDDDSLTDLINRLSKMAKYKEKYSQKLKEKLESQFKKLVSSYNCSEKVRNKLQTLTQESKLIIIGVSEPEKCDNSLNQTPFKILLDNSTNMRKQSVDRIRKPYSYENNENNGSPLIGKYNIKVTPEVNYESRREGDKIDLKYQYPSGDSHGYGYQQSNRRVLEDKINLKEYSPIININSKRSIKSNHYDNRMQLATISEDEERNRKEGCIRKLNDRQRNLNIGYKQSFQDYKMQKNKSHSLLGRANMVQNARNYITNQQDKQILPYPHKLNYNLSHQALTKINYSTNYESKPYIAAVRGGKKYSYLSQDHC